VARVLSPPEREDLPAFSCDGVAVPLATGLDGLRELQVDAGYVAAAETGEWLNRKEV